MFLEKVVSEVIEGNDGRVMMSDSYVDVKKIRLELVFEFIDVGLNFSYIRFERLYLVKYEIELNSS